VHTSRHATTAMAQHAPMGSSDIQKTLQSVAWTARDQTLNGAGPVLPAAHADHTIIEGPCFESPAKSNPNGDIFSA
jgi:hypothetical protein